MDSGNRNALIEAVVNTAEGETPYLRAGSGRPVLLLTEADAVNGYGPALAGHGIIAGLAAHFRVYAPTARAAANRSVRCGRSDSTVDAQPWLRNLIDALGLDVPLIVADESFADIAYDFARSDADRTTGVVIATGSDAETLLRRLGALPAR
jgi:hypothetical protein